MKAPNWVTNLLVLAVCLVVAYGAVKLADATIYKNDKK